MGTGRLLWLRWVVAFLVLIGVSKMASGQQAQSGRAMLEAAGRGDVETLQRLIAAGAALDPVNAAGETPLLLAVRNNHLSAAALLIDAGGIIRMVFNSPLRAAAHARKAADAVASLAADHQSTER